MILPVILQLTRGVLLRLKITYLIQVDDKIVKRVSSRGQNIIETLGWTLGTLDEASLHHVENVRTGMLVHFLPQPVCKSSVLRK